MKDLSFPNNFGLEKCIKISLFDRKWKKDLIEKEDVREI